MAATLKFSSMSYFSLLIIVLVSSSYLTCNIHAQHVEQNHHFHTVQISSLLPSSSCSQPTTIKGSMKVIHKHSPCSQLGQNTTTLTSFTEILSQDKSRVELIQARAAPNLASTLSVSNSEATLPVQSESSFGTGNYFVEVGLGTPARNVSLVFDTASDLTWTQCQPCVVSCYRQQDPIFDPSTSTSYSNISCGSTLCSQISNSSCFASLCVYQIVYGDQSFSAGVYSRETLTISSTDIFPDFLFGCGQNNQGVFGRAAGILALSRDPSSLVSQTASKYGEYFSYCIPSTPSSTGYLSLGKTNAASSTNATTLFTPFANSAGDAAFYYIDILSISVGGRKLAISESVFSSGGTIIDSGTVITRLPPKAYTKMRKAFRSLMRLNGYRRGPAFSILDTCYDFGNDTTSVNIPAVSFTFGGHVTVELDPSGILVAIVGSNSTRRGCLAFAANRRESGVAIFGNTQQKTLNVVYDVAGGKLGFGPAGCI